MYEEILRPIEPRNVSLSPHWGFILEVLRRRRKERRYVNFVVLVVRQDARDHFLTALSGAGFAQGRLLCSSDGILVQQWPLLTRDGTYC